MAKFTPMADEIFLRLQGEELFNGIIELLIMNLSETKALSSVIIDKLADSEHEKHELIKTLKEESSEYAKAIIQMMQMHRGHIDLNDLLK